MNVNTSDASGIAKVEFSLDGTLMSTVTDAPYSWAWTNRSFGRHTITVVSYDAFGNNATQSLSVRKFF